MAVIFWVSLPILPIINFMVSIEFVLNMDPIKHGNIIQYVKNCTYSCFSKKEKLVLCKFAYDAKSDSLFYLDKVRDGTVNRWLVIQEDEKSNFHQMSLHVMLATLEEMVLSIRYCNAVTGQIITKILLKWQDCLQVSFICLFTPGFVQLGPLEFTSLFQNFPQPLHSKFRNQLINRYIFEIF